MPMTNFKRISLCQMALSKSLISMEEPKYYKPQHITPYTILYT